MTTLGFHIPFVPCSAAERNGHNYEKWIIDYVGEGYYKLLLNASGLAITAPSSLNSHIKQSAYTGATTQQWKVTETGGMYKFSPRSNASAYLAAGDSPLTTYRNDIWLMQNQTDYSDEWIICNNDKSLLLAIKDSDGALRHSYFLSTKSNLSTEKNSMISIVTTSRYSSCTIPTMINYLKSSDIFIVHTHGRQTGFKISNSNTTYISINDLTGEDLSNLNFALLLTCNTGLNYNPSNIKNKTPVNIIEQMVICGAETVVGFKDETKVFDCNKFAPDITEKLIEGGLCVEDAIDSISYTFYVNDMSNIAVIAGNGNNKLR